MITQRGQEIIDDRPSHFCPMTSNQKFETFLDDLFSLKLRPADKKRNITNYLKAVETHYTDIIEGQKIKMEQTEKQCKRKVG